MEPNKPVHIFIVGDEKMFVNMLDYIFTKDLSYRFLDFRSGEDCLRNLSLGPLIVVLDFRLPGMNGLETLLEIREQNPEVLVIMLSGPNDGKLPVEMLNAGADMHILKDGNEAAKVIEKVEELLAAGQRDRAPTRSRKRVFGRKLYYALLLLALLLSLGYYYYI